MLLSVASVFAQSATLKATGVEQEKGAMVYRPVFNFTEHWPAFTHPSSTTQNVTKGLFTIGLDFMEVGNHYVFISPKSVILGPDQIDLDSNGNPKQYYIKTRFEPYFNKDGCGLCEGDYCLECHYHFYGRDMKGATGNWWTYPGLPAGDYAVIVKEDYGAGEVYHNYLGDVHIEAPVPKEQLGADDSLVLDSGFDGKITVNAQTSEADKTFPLIAHLPDAVDATVFISPDNGGVFDYNSHVFMQNAFIEPKELFNHFAPPKSIVLEEDNPLNIYSFWGWFGEYKLFPYVWRSPLMSLYSANMESWQAVSGVYIGMETPDRLAHILKPGDYKFTVMYANKDKNFYMSEFHFKVCHGADCEGGGDGIKELDNIVKLYPNPTSGALTIIDTRHNLSVPEEGGLRIDNVEIFDVVGRKVLEERPCPCKQDNIDISRFPAGMYFVRIQTEQGTITQKIVKQ